MTYDEYVNSVYVAHARAFNYGINAYRLGQRYYNGLPAFVRDVINGTENDPFYYDTLWPDLHIFVEKLWDDAWEPDT